LIINKIGSLRVRNIVRGMLANPDPSAVKSGLNKISLIASDADYKASLIILRNSQLFRSNSVTRYFPRRFSRPPELPDYQVREIVECINENREKLVRLIDTAVTIVNHVSSNDFTLGVNSAKNLASEEGVSIFLLRICYLIKNRSDRSELTKQVDSLLESIQASNMRYPQLAIRELSNPNTEYLNIREKISLADAGAMSYIAKSFIDHIPRSQNQFQNILKSYFGVSLLDALFYYMSVARSGLFADTKALDESLVSSFGRLASLRPSREYAETEDPGLAFFRDGFLLIELDECFEYRTCHAAIYNNLEDKAFTRTPFESSLISKYFSNIRSLQDVEQFVDVELLNNEVDAQPWFERSNGLVYFLEKTDGQVIDEVVFVELMSLTRDIGVICPKRYLISMSQKAETDEFKLVVACLAYVKTRTQLNEHELRETIQEVAMSKFASNITGLLDHLYLKSPAVTEHLIQVLDETFLTKLFDIVDRPNTAIEFRAEMFEWYSGKTGDLTYLDRAKNLRIDVQINKAKGTIDDARIYVDPVKFTQWFTDNLLNELLILLGEISVRGEPAVVSIAWDKVKAGITDIEQVGTILISAYEEFCSNNKFGIASYIGRRIRHGTLKGTGFSDVKAFRHRPEFANLFASVDFDQCFGIWLKGYEDCLNQMRDKYIQIQDKKKPEGLITLDFKTVAKRITANHMLYEVIKSFHHNKNGQEIPYIITEYCWRLVEEDLASIRGFIMDQKAKFGVFRGEVGRDLKVRHRDVQEFAQDLNTVVADRFRLIESWFNKPSIASPSAELLLLFKAVVSEIQGFFGDFEPELLFDELGYVIRGGAYFVIYDALFIIIYNAARYGKKDGKLGFYVAFTEMSGVVNFRISINSELAMSDDMSIVRNSISSALNEDCEDALVIEGRSGIKKLKRMELDSYIHNVDYCFAFNEVMASFEFALDYQS